MSKKRKPPKEVVEISSSDDDDILIVSENIVKKPRTEDVEPPKYLHKDDELYVKEMTAHCEFFGYCDFGKATPPHRFINLPSKMLPKAVNAVGKEIADLSSKDSIDGTLLTQSSAIFIRADLNRP